MTSRSPLDLSQHEEAVASLRTGYRPACCCDASEVQVRSASAKNSLFWAVSCGQSLLVCGSRAILHRRGQDPLPALAKPLMLSLPLAALPRVHRPFPSVLCR